MKFLVDRCVGHRLSVWLRGQGHDVVESREVGHDPGDWELLKQAAVAGRILVTIDTDFGELIYVRRARHAGLVRLPDVPVKQRVALMSQTIERHRAALENQAVVTIRGGRVRISLQP